MTTAADSGASPDTPRHRILVGDVRARLAELGDDSVHCVVTSPPYWGLRDYGVPGQLGLEPTLGEHLDTLVAVFREVRRVLRANGTVWLNYGDCYASAPNGRSAADTKATGNDDRTFRDKPFSTVGPVYEQQPARRQSARRGRSGNLNNGGPFGVGIPSGRVVAGGYLKPKDLVMAANRLAIALQDDGWWVRSENIWAKPNPMPDSVTDRPTVAHEKIWLLTKSARYYYDAPAVLEPFADARQGRDGGKRPPQRNRGGRIDGFTKPNNIDPSHRGGRNLRTVWTIPIAPFPDAHFATFPPALAETCIKAGCPAGGVVLDPFAGSGTTGLVADRLKRRSILIELNPDYAAMAAERIRADAPMLTSVVVG